WAIVILVDTVYSSLHVDRCYNTHMLNAPPLPSSDPSYDSMKIQAAHSIAFYVDLNRLDLFLSSRVIAHKGRFLLCVSGLLLPFLYLLTGEQTYVESDSTYTASF